LAVAASALWHRRPGWADQLSPHPWAVVQRKHSRLRLLDEVRRPGASYAVVSMLHGWWMPAPTCRRGLDNPFYRLYAVLTMCHMRYTLQYGVVVSKAMAARWAQAALDARWTR
jgi:hypothetical protein